MNNKTVSSLPNLGLFQQVMCLVLQQTQDAFPNPIDISCTALAYQIAPGLAEPAKQPIDLAVEISSVISWLEKAGLIWVGGHDLNDYFDVTLSQQGLAKLLLDIEGETLAEKLCAAHTAPSQLEVVKLLIKD